MAKKQTSEPDAAAPSQAAAARTPKASAPKPPTQRHRKATAPVEAVPEPAIPVAVPEVVSLVSHDDIARLAYHLWEARDGSTGSPEEDWIQAEQMLKAAGA